MQKSAQDFAEYANLYLHTRFEQKLKAGLYDLFAFLWALWFNSRWKSASYESVVKSVTNPAILAQQYQSVVLFIFCGVHKTLSLYVLWGKLAPRTKENLTKKKTDSIRIWNTAFYRVFCAYFDDNTAVTAQLKYEEWTIRTHLWHRQNMLTIPISMEDMTLRYDLRWNGEHFSDRKSNWKRNLVKPKSFELFIYQSSSGENQHEYIFFSHEVSIWARKPYCYNLCH